MGREVGGVVGWADGEGEGGWGSGGMGGWGGGGREGGGVVGWADGEGEGGRVGEWWDGRVGREGGAVRRRASVLVEKLVKINLLRCRSGNRGLP